MSDKDLPFILLRIFTIFFPVFSFCFFCVNSTNPWVITPVEIVTKTEFPANCIDGDGVTRTHLHNWTSSAGACDRRVCYEGALETIKWQINYDCPEQIEFLDTVNCEYVLDSTLTFPQCCPYLVCSNISATTTTLAPCSDRSPTFACEYWKNQTNCTDNSNSLLHDLFNFTLGNCDLTCGYCT
ncbi:uncharacterized protein LOC123523305 [Mercenaria mercenaria]|uniref:uncharacterized protein LOC123523305 n=1 Tax=Mercenaria mercenaria TaxID=6596 RepID=UPI00234F2073|nr:uncharacterized protein LOC123523305 [Mercenaria mercenaria]